MIANVLTLMELEFVNLLLISNVCILDVLHKIWHYEIEKLKNYKDF